MPFFLGEGCHFGPSISPVPGLTIEPGELQKNMHISGWQEAEVMAFN